MNLKVILLLLCLLQVALFQDPEHHRGGRFRGNGANDSPDTNIPHDDHQDNNSPSGSPQDDNSPDSQDANLPGVRPDDHFPNADHQDSNFPRGGRDDNFPGGPQDDDFPGSDPDDSIPNDDHHDNNFPGHHRDDNFPNADHQDNNFPRGDRDDQFSYDAHQDNFPGHHRDENFPHGHRGDQFPDDNFPGNYYPDNDGYPGNSNQCTIYLGPYDDEVNLWRGDSTYQQSNSYLSDLEFDGYCDCFLYAYRQPNYGGRMMTYPFSEADGYISLNRGAGSFVITCHF